MTQPHHTSAIEASTNATVGLLASWGFTYYGLPLYGLSPSPAVAVEITAWYFVLSFVRSYVIRRVFN